MKGKNKITGAGKKINLNWPLFGAQMSLREGQIDHYERSLLSS